MGNGHIGSGLLHDYYIERKAVKTIAEEYSIEVPRRIFEHFKPYEYHDLTCECCGEKLVSKFTGRDNSTMPLVLHFDIYEKEPVEVECRALSSHIFHGRFLHLQNTNNTYLTAEEYKVGFPYCPSCSHRPSLNCQCKSCGDLKERNREIVCLRLLKNSEVISDPLQLNNLSTKDIFVVLYMLTYQIKELDKGIVPKSIGPVSKEQLIRSSLIAQDQSKEAIESCVEMISIVEFTLYKNKLPYVLNLDYEGSRDVLLADLKREALKTAMTTDGQLDLVEIWSELALLEALNLLKHYCNVFKLSYNPGEKTVSTIKRCLNRFGLAQSARYIYNSTKNAHTYALEKGINAKQAFNSICRNINFWMNDEKCRNWNAPPFTRNKGETLEEPPFSIVFSHSFLETYGVDYFTMPINIKSFANN